MVANIRPTHPPLIQTLIRNKLVKLLVNQLNHQQASGALQFQEIHSSILVLCRLLTNCVVHSPMQIQISAPQQPQMDDVSDTACQTALAAVCGCL